MIQLKKFGKEHRVITESKRKEGIMMRVEMSKF